MPSSTPASDTAGATTKSSDGGGSNPASNSPLLFFVALGFGVVFANLWIIVGVKYWFRYSRRNRHLRGEESESPIDMMDITRPHRRRREKKLMTMDEANERFPLIKYKTWKSSRAISGLKTADGNTAPNSTSENLKDGSGLTSTSLSVTPATPLPMKSHGQYGLDMKATNYLSVSETVSPQVACPNNSAAKLSRDKSENSPGKQEDSDDEGYLIRTAVPIHTELVSDPGDTCAVCLDTIEDDDDIRGLACGHAFHAACIDPWLTSRRACCPLCKTDYYTPKPRYDAAEDTADTERRGRRTTDQTHALSEPPAAFVGVREDQSRTSMFLPARLFQRTYTEQPTGHPWRHPNSTTSPNDQHGRPVGFAGRSNWIQRFGLSNIRRLSVRSFRLPGLLLARNRETHPSATTSHPGEDRTLGQLEAGSRA